MDNNDDDKPFNKKACSKAAKRYYDAMQTALAKVANDQRLNDCELQSGSECTCAERSLAWSVAMTVSSSVFAEGLIETGMFGADEKQFANDLVSSGVAAEKAMIALRMGALDGAQVLAASNAKETLQQLASILGVDISSISADDTAPEKEQSKPYSGSAANWGGKDPGIQ